MDMLFVYLRIGYYPNSTFRFFFHEAFAAKEALDEWTDRFCPAIYFIVPHHRSIVVSLSLSLEHSVRVALQCEWHAGAIYHYESLE